MTFKIGDRVVMVRNFSSLKSIGHRGTVISEDLMNGEFCYSILWDDSTLNDNEENLIYEDELEHEHIYNSPLNENLK